MENEEKENETAKITSFYCLLELNSEATSLNSNLPLEKCEDLSSLFTQRQQKGLIHSSIGTVILAELGKQYGCYYYTFDNTGIEDSKFIICFLLEDEHPLELFRMDLDAYCTSLVPCLLKVTDKANLPESVVQSLENWYSVAIDYMLRCKLAVRDNLKYLIHAALLDKKLVMSGGTEELQSDIQRFYSACSLSDILSQLRDSRTKQDGGSMSNSLDMLLDLDGGQTDTQGTLNVSITVDSVKLDSNGCNRFCEDWSNTMSRPEFQDNPVKLKQVIETFKLKFIQTMNMLKRLLREAEQDYYALYRSYVFLRESGNTEVLLHYVTTEGASDTVNVLRVLQDFILEQHAL